jgi:hypothetical protein
MMKARILLLAVIVLAGCESVPSNLIPPGEPLTPDKAYLAGVFFYEDRINPPYMNLRSTEKKSATITFYSATSTDVTVHVVEPGVYEVRSIQKFEQRLMNVMNIPYELRGKITVKPGSVTYLGDYWIQRRQGLLGVSFRSKYDYNFERFKHALQQKYTVSEAMEIRVP